MAKIPVYLEGKPKRRRRLKRLGLAVLVIEVLALVVVAWWQITTLRRLDAASGQRPLIGRHQKLVVAAVDPYSGWKTYHSNYEHADFKYPPEWQFTRQPGSAENIAITSLGGFSVHWYAPIGPTTGACSIKTNVTIDQVTPLPDAHAQNPLFLTVLSQGNRMLALVDKANNRPPAVGDSGSCLVYPSFASKSHPGVRIQFASTNGNHVGQDTSLTTPDQSAQDYLADPEVQEATLILKSFNY